MRMNDAAALKVLREIAQDSVRVIFTHHARLRMRQRKVSPVQVLACLQRGIVSEPVALDGHGNWKLTVTHRVAGKDLDVAAAIDIPKRVIVITVFQEAGMYHYRECGLRNVWLANGYVEHDTPYGPGIAIHDVEGLHLAIARGLVSKGGKLTGSELRFLRQEMSLSQAKLATMLGNEAQTVALWEKRGSQPRIADRFIRAIYREQDEGNAHIREMIERLVDADIDECNARITLEQGGNGWKVAA